MQVGDMIIPAFPPVDLSRLKSGVAVDVRLVIQLAPDENGIVAARCSRGYLFSFTVDSITAIHEPAPAPVAPIGVGDVVVITDEPARGQWIVKAIDERTAFLRSTTENARSMRALADLTLLIRVAPVDGGG